MSISPGDVYFIGELGEPAEACNPFAAAHWSNPNSALIGFACTVAGPKIDPNTNKVVYWDSSDQLRVHSPDPYDGENIYPPEWKNNDELLDECPEGMETTTHFPPDGGYVCRDCSEDPCVYYYADGTPMPDAVSGYSINQFGYDGSIRFDGIQIYAPDSSTNTIEFTVYGEDARTLLPGQRIAWDWRTHPEGFRLAQVMGNSETMTGVLVHHINFDGSVELIGTSVVPDDVTYKAVVTCRLSSTDNVICGASDFGDRYLVMSTPDESVEVVLRDSPDALVHFRGGRTILFTGP